MKFTLLLVLAAGIGFLISRTRSRSPKNRGEAAVRNALQSNFKSPDYHLLNKVTLRLEDGTTQVDHILVSRFVEAVAHVEHMIPRRQPPPPRRESVEIC